jgi:hypothetical protein
VRQWLEDVRAWCATTWPHRSIVAPVTSAA